MTRQVRNFAIAGGAGFVADAGILYLAVLSGIGPYIGRFLSFFCAVYVTWQINRRITFANAAPRGTLPEFSRYFLAMAFGGLVNFGAYALTLHLVPATPWTPLLGVAVGSGVALFINFTSSKLWVFRQKP